MCRIASVINVFRRNFIVVEIHVDISAGGVTAGIVEASAKIELHRHRDRSVLIARPARESGVRGFELKRDTRPFVIRVICQQSGGNFSHLVFKKSVTAGPGRVDACRDIGTGQSR